MKVLKLLMFVICSSILNVNLAQIKSGCVKHYGTEEGLPSNLIYYIEQDKLGYLWLGTDAGLVRFDGSNFKVFTTADGLPSNDIISLYCDSKNRLWISGFGKELCYMKDGNIVSKINNPAFNKYSLNNNYVNPIEDKKGNIWIASSSKDVLLYNGIEFKNKWTQGYYTINKLLTHKEDVYILSDFGLATLQHMKQKKKQKHDKEVVDIIFLPPKLVVSYDTNNVVDIDTMDNNQLPYNYNSSAIYRSVYPDTDSSIWAKYSKGFKLIDIKSKNPKVLDEFQNLNISRLLKDKDGNTWISTLDKGLYKIYAKGVRTIGESNLSSNNTYYSLCVDKGIIYSGNMVGEVWKFKPDSKPEKIIDVKGPTNRNRVMQLNFIAKDKLVFVADYKSSLIDLVKNKTEKDFLKMGNFKSLYIKGDSIIFLNGEGLVFYSMRRNNKSFIPMKIRTYSACEYKGQLVFGTINGLYILNKDKYVPFLQGENLDSRVSDLQTDGEYLYACTVEKGVYKIKGNKCIAHYSIENGLPSNSCNKMILKDQSLYIATKEGIAIFNLKNAQAKYIFERDGLISDNVNNIAIYNDSLIAATDIGISIFRISQLPEPLKPLFYISASGYMKDSVHHFLSLKSHNDKELLINFNSISFENNEKMKYYYRILEQDVAWSYTIDHSKQINGLKPGKYHFQAFAQTSYGVQSDAIEMEIEIIPYYYQTYLFKIFIGLVICGLLYLLYQYRIRIIKNRERHQKEMDHRITTLELSAWRSKMNPHFIFNSLNAMQSLFEEQDFLTGNKYIVNFSKILRKTIESSSNMFNTIKEEIDYQNNYLELEKLKKEGKLIYTIKAPEELYLYYIPSMVLQPIIENSIKHGIKSSQEGRIIIDFTKIDNGIICSILDNGNGIEAGKKDSSQGIDLIREKLLLIMKLIDNEIVFKYENLKNDSGKTIGVKTTFIFPLISATHINKMNIK